MSALQIEDVHAEPGDDAAVEQVMAALRDLPPASHDAVLRRVAVEAVRFQRTRDLAPVVYLFDSLLMTARLYRNPAYEKALHEADAAPPPDLAQAHDVTDVVSQMRARAARGR